MKSRLSRVVDWAERSQAAHYNLKVLAEKCGVSRAQLCRYLAWKTGKHPHDWLNAMRHEVALARLKRGDSVKETAYALGYSDPAHFSRDFKKVHGIHPREVRAARVPGPKGEQS